MFIGSAKKYRFQTVEPKELAIVARSFDIFDNCQQCVAAKAWALGEKGEMINESPLEFLFNPNEHKAAILVARSAHKATVTAAASIEDAIERFLRIGGKDIE